MTGQPPAPFPAERRISANGLEFHVEERGDPSGEPLLLVMGLGAQMTLWPEPLLEQLTEAGFRVIRFDNRDIGLSSEIKAPLGGSPSMAMARFRLGLSIEAPYTLHHMAQDLEGLMDALALESAHLMGVSMGGMISQLVAARSPGRVRSLTLVMTSSNSPRLPMPRLPVVWGLNGSGIKGHHEDAAVARSLALWRHLQSPAWPVSQEELEERIRRDYRRSYRPKGILRQMRAILATGSLVAASRRIQAPTRIVHGTADPLVRPAAARELRSLIPNSELSWFAGMGHDLPEPIFPEMVEQVRQLAER